MVQLLVQEGKSLYLFYSYIHPYSSNIKDIRKRSLWLIFSSKKYCTYMSDFHVHFYYIFPFYTWLINVWLHSHRNKDSLHGISKWHRLSLNRNQWPNNTVQMYWNLLVLNFLWPQTCIHIKHISSSSCWAIA